MSKIIVILSKDEKLNKLIIFKLGINVTVGRTYTDVDDRTDIDYFKELEVQALLLDLEVEKEEEKKGSGDVILENSTERDLKEGENEKEEKKEKKGKLEEGEKEKEEEEEKVKPEEIMTRRMAEGKEEKDEGEGEEIDSNSVENTATCSDKKVKREISEVKENDMIESETVSPYLNTDYHNYHYASAVHHELSAYQNNCVKTRAFFNQLIHSQTNKN